MNREELIRVLASYRPPGSPDTSPDDDEAERQFIRDLLTKPDDRFAQAMKRIQNGNPARPGPVSAEDRDRHRDFVRQLFGRGTGDDAPTEDPTTNP